MAHQTLQVADFERRWVEGLNRGDLSVADEVFAPGCLVHITGSPVPDLPLDGSLAGRATVNGSTATRLAVEGDVTHQGSTGPSWLVGTASVPMGAGRGSFAVTPPSGLTLYLSSQSWTTKKPFSPCASVPVHPWKVMLSPILGS